MRKYLVPIYYDQIGKEVTEIHPDIVLFLEEAKILFPLEEEDTSLEAARKHVS